MIIIIIVVVTFFFFLKMKNNAVMFSGKRTFVSSSFFSFITANTKERESSYIYVRDEKVCVAAKTTDVRDKMFWWVIHGQPRRGGGAEWPNEAGKSALCNFFHLNFTQWSTWTPKFPHESFYRPFIRQQYNNTSNSTI